MRARTELLRRKALARLSGAEEGPESPHELFREVGVLVRMRVFAGFVVSVVT